MAGSRTSISYPECRSNEERTERTQRRPRKDKEVPEKRILMGLSRLRPTMKRGSIGREQEQKDMSDFSLSYTNELSNPRDRCENGSKLKRARHSNDVILPSVRRCSLIPLIGRYELKLQVSRTTLVAGTPRIHGSGNRVRVCTCRSMHITSPGIVHMRKVAVLAADLNIDLRYSHEKIHKYQILPGDDDKEMDEGLTLSAAANIAARSLGDIPRCSKNSQLL